MTKRVELSLLILILLVAAAMRLWRLDSVPPGLTHDEAGHGHDAVAILNGDRPIYQTVGYGREPLYDYLVAALMGLLGPGGQTLRFSPVLLGLLTCIFTFVWVRLAFDGPIALAALAFQSVSFWSLSTSRQALRSGLLPVLFTAAVVFFWRYFKSPERPGFQKIAPAALFLGATFYTYIPARIMWVLFPVFLVYLAMFQRPTFRRVWRPTLAVLVIALLLAVPLFAFLRAHPGAEQRLAMLDEPLDALRQGNVVAALQRAGSAVTGMLLPGSGDDFLAYTIPGRATLDPLTGLLFLIGLAICVARWRESACAFSLLWLVIGISPALITGATASSTRSIAALPVVYLFPALAVLTAARWAVARWGSRVARASGIGIAGAVILIGTLSARDYFVRWGESADVRAAYQQTVVEMARYLEQHHGDEGVALSSIYPHAPHDPYVFEMALRRQDISLHWFDGRRAIRLPAEPVNRLMAPASASLDPYFADLAGLHVRERVALRSDDLDPFFIVYDWVPEFTLEALSARATGVPAEFDLPVNLGDALQLSGFDLRTPAVPPGGTIELVTLWRIVDPRTLRSQDLADVSAELVLFTQALDGQNSVVGQDDRLDAPTWDWHAGDTVAQIHRFSLRTDLSPGPISLRVGAYRRADLTRLPVLVDGEIAGDSVLLASVEVTGP